MKMGWLSSGVFEFSAGSGSLRTFEFENFGGGSANVRLVEGIINQDGPGDNTFEGNLNTDGTLTTTGNADILGKLLFENPTANNVRITSDGYFRLDVAAGSDIVFAGQNDFYIDVGAGDDLYFRVYGGATVAALDINTGNFQIDGAFQQDGAGIYGDAAGDILDSNGTVYGDNIAITFSREAQITGVAATTYIKYGEITSSTSKGFIAPQAGSIVGLSVNADVINITGNITTNVMVNGASVLLVTHAVAVDDDKYIVQVKGTDTFAAGDTISVAVVTVHPNADIDQILATVFITYRD